MQHISEELIDEYTLGRLVGAQAAAVEKHLLICNECQDRLRLTEDFVRALRATIHAQPGDAHSRGGDVPAQRCARCGQSADSGCLCGDCRMFFERAAERWLALAGPQPDRKLA